MEMLWLMDDVSVSFYCNLNNNTDRGVILAWMYGG